MSSSAEMSARGQAPAEDGRAAPPAAHAGSTEEVPAERAKISLRLQADEAHRELTMRHRVYPGLVKRGKMSEAEKAVAIDTMRAIRDSLRLFARFEDAVRAAIAREIAKEQLSREAEALRDHPSVEAVFDEFPGAEIAGLRRLA